MADATKVAALHFAPIDASDTDVVVIGNSTSGYPRTKIEADALIRARQVYLQSLLLLQYKVAYQFRLYVSERQADEVEVSAQESREAVEYYDGLLDHFFDTPQLRALYC